MWGAIWYDGKTTLHVTKERFNKDDNVEVRQEHLAPELPLGGNALSTMATIALDIVLDWCEINGVSLIEDFPAKSQRY